MKRVFSKYKLFSLICASMLFGFGFKADVNAENEDNGIYEEVVRITSENESTDVVELDLSEDLLQKGALVTDSDSATENIEVSLVLDLEEEIDDALKNRNGIVDLSEYELSVDEVEGVLADYVNDNPGFFYLDEAYVEYEITTDNATGLYLGYLAGSENTSLMYENRVASILADIEADWSDEEKLIYIHDYIVTHCQYDLTCEKYTASDALVGGSAVCQGYALAFKDLANRVGIETEFVSSDDLIHAWNLVVLNGKHYYIDCTWDDPISGNSTSQAHYYEDYCSHKNFLCSRTTFSSNHNSTDWKIDGNSVYSLYNDTEYDNAGWKDSNSSIALAGSAIYYLSNNGRIYSYNKASHQSTELATVGPGPYWSIIGQNGQYPVSFGNIFYADGKIFVNDYKEIYKYNVSNGIFSRVYALTDSEMANGYIYGMRLDGNRIRYSLARDYKDTDFYEYKYVDLSSELGTVVTNLTLNTGSIQFTNLSGTSTLTATTTPLNQNVTWSSSDTSVATVSNGIVTPVGYGMAVITAKADRLKATCIVYVNTDWQNDYTYSFYDYGGKLTLEKYNGDQKNIVVPSVACINGRVCEVVIDYWCEFPTDIVSFSVEPGVKVNSQGFRALFNKSRLVNVDLSNLDLSGVTDMNNMFSGCSSLQTIDLTMFNTHNVKSMWGMFKDCTSLRSINIHDMDLASVENMQSMFEGCTSLTSIDFSNVNAPNLKNMEEMFRGCSNLTTVNFNGFKTGKLTHTYEMFYGCKKLKNIDMSSLNTSSVTNRGFEFYDCLALEKVDASGFNFSTNSFMTGPLFYNCPALKEVVLKNTVWGSNMNYELGYIGSLEKIDLTGANTDNVTSVSDLFSGCSKLKTLDLSSLNTRNVTDFSNMFNGCSELTTLNINGFNTSKAENLSYMFCGCKKLNEISLPDFNTSNVKNFSSMFRDCTGLEKIDLSNFDTSKAEYMYCMFQECESLVSADLSNFNTANVTTLEYMFQNCKSLKSVNITSFNTAKCTSFVNMFDGCSSLKELDLSSFDLSKASNDYYGYNGVISRCYALEKIKTPKEYGIVTCDYLPDYMYILNGDGTTSSQGYQNYFEVSPCTVLVKECNPRGEQEENNGENSQGGGDQSSEADQSGGITETNTGGESNQSSEADQSGGITETNTGGGSNQSSEADQGGNQSEQETSVTMLRLYNPNSGEHFYTSSEREKNSLVKVGWSYEGIAWVGPAWSNTPVYRLYNENSGDHHYTTKAKERDSLVKAGWKDEGIGWYSDDAKAKPLYRLYNPNATTGSHHYTTSSKERDQLVKIGWNDEGIGWYGYAQ